MNETLYIYVLPLNWITISMFRLVGCQDLLEDTPSKFNRRRDSGSTTPGVLSPTETKTLERKSKTRSSSKHNLREDIGGELMTGLLALGKLSPCTCTSTSSVSIQTKCFMIFQGSSLCGVNCMCDAPVVVSANSKECWCGV